MKTPTLHTRGGDRAYLAPSLDVTAVEVEQGFATSPASSTWEDSLNGELNYGDGSDQFE